MLGGDGHSFLLCCNYQSPPGQVICFTEQTSCPLVDGGDGGIFKQIAGDACDSEVVSDILLHLSSVYAFEMATGHHA